MNDTQSDILKLRIEAGDQTEDLTQFILSRVPDDQLDEVEVDHIFDHEAQTANEPFSIGIILTVAIGAEAVVGALKAVQSISEAIKSYIEYRTKQLEAETASEPHQENIKVFILSGETPKELSALPGNQYLNVAVQPAKTTP